MSDTCDRCRGLEGVHEYPFVTIEKYSPDQTAFAERKLFSELSWGRRVLVSKLNIRVPKLHGDWLRELFGEPEDGYAYQAGNQMVTNGLENLIYLLLGTTASGGFGRTLINAQSGIGVGAGTTAATYADTHLTDDAGSAWYQQMDSTYPSYAGSGTANGGQINGQATVAAANAVFAWQEWCWFSTSAAITAGATLASVGTNANMFNHKVASLGTKGSGAAWVFSNTMTFS